MFVLYVARNNALPTKTSEIAEEIALCGSKGDPVTVYRLRTTER